MALIDNAFYVNFGNGSSTGYFAVTKRPQNTAVAAGVIRRQFTAPSDWNWRCFICVVAGTTANTTDATWTLTRGALSTDGTATWQECTGIAAFNGDLTNTPNWTTVKNTAVTLGQVIQRNNGASYQICSTAGTAGNGSEPSFSNTAGTTTADNTVTWTSCGVVGGFSIWNCPHAAIAAAFNQGSAGWVQPGNVVYISDASAATFTGQPQMSVTNSATLADTRIICVKNAPATTPPGNGDASTGATETGTGGNLHYINQNTNGRMYFYGITFSITTNGNAFYLAQGSNSTTIFDNCNFTTTASYTYLITCGGAFALEPLIDFRNCTFSFHTATQYINPQSNLKIIWRNCTISGTALTSHLFYTSNNCTCEYFIEGTDFSSMSGIFFDVSTTSVFNKVSALVKDCKLNSAASFYGTQSSYYGTVDVVRCDSGTKTYRNERHTISGDMTTTSTAIRTGGSTDGTTAYALQLITTASLQWDLPFELFPFDKWNSTTGSRTVTFYGVYNGAALPTNTQIWMDVLYLSDSGDPLGSLAKGTTADILATGSALTADTSAWDTAAAARANTHAYVVGDQIAVSSASGQLFFCTTSGTSSGSLPGGYASCVDGGSVTDGTAVFRSGMRFSQAVTCTVQLAGYMRGHVRSALPSATFIVDPQIYLS